MKKGFLLFILILSMLSSGCASKKRPVVAPQQPDEKTVVHEETLIPDKAEDVKDKEEKEPTLAEVEVHVDREDSREQDYEDNKVVVNEIIDCVGSTLTLKSYAILDSHVYENKRVIVLTFDYQNNDDYEWHFMCSVNDVYQGGVRLEHAGDILDRDATTQIRQGTTLEIVKSYTLRNETDSLEFSFKNPDDFHAENEIIYKLDIAKKVNAE